MLQRTMEKKRSGEGGFTLIELLIVIVILGILAAIVVFAVGGITDRGQTSSCAAEKSTVETAVEAYYAKNNAYPGSVAVLTAAPNKFLHSTPAHYTSIAADGTVSGTCP